MKITTVVGKTTIEVEGRDAKHCFEQMAAAQEIFGEYTCGACGSDEVPAGAFPALKPVA